ncbi:hypothetical protein BOX15_Mlig000140g29 [Macrostomum lignano]|uniref:Ubiquitin-like protease family profile domain-containing protein n=1 Tax=Macrostomum lignano TaxID=282301 RepID=A0A267DU04_9PLAT|nr:hypothetical protein BOX15_Mlig000140g29 [Macrostomum lignano]
MMAESSKPKRMIAESPQSKRRMAESAQPKRRMAESPQPKRRMAESAQPKRRMAESPQPKRRMAESAQPKRRMAESPQPKRRMAESAQPKRRMAESPQPKRRMAESAQPKRRMAESPQPKRRMAESAQPKRRMAESPQPKRRMAESAQSKRRMAESAQPKRRMAESAQSKRRMAESAQSKRRMAESAQPKRRMAESAQFNPRTTESTQLKTRVGKRAQPKRRMANSAQVNRRQTSVELKSTKNPLVSTSINQLFHFMDKKENSKCPATSRKFITSDSKRLKILPTASAKSKKNRNENFTKEELVPCFSTQEKYGKFCIRRFDRDSLLSERSWISVTIINALLAAVASQHDGAAFLLHYEVDILFRGVEDQFTAELIDKLHNAKKAIIGTIYRNQHFMLLFVDLERHNVAVLDPLLSSEQLNISICANLNSVRHCFGWHEMQPITIKHSIQQDGNSCGVLVCKFADLLLSDSSLNINSAPREMALSRLELWKTLLLRAVDQENLCWMCGEKEAASHDGAYDNWIQCEKCFIWFHEACIRQSCISTCVFCDRI